MRDGDSEQLLTVEVELFAAFGPERFGEFRAQLNLYTVAHGSRWPHKAKRQALVRFALFEFEAPGGIVSHGELAAKLERMLQAHLARDFPGGLELRFMGFSQDADRALTL